ncbi:Hypothetical_protein [Hexamita inflata]|uniref:Hypothetical_protein n=1 Tax=Hexamita inflata TaxID=28002 RepID=A0AA86U591_9EUKA|nr:Hypothetical protein HINF_LOCUS18528 [Hexamita inflata]
MFSQIDSLVPELAAALGIPPENAQINSVVYSALMLPDQSYCQMLGQISRNMNVDDSTISHMFQYLVDRTLKVNSALASPNQANQVSLQKQTRKTKLSQLQFNYQFEAALKSALVDVNRNALSMSSQKLCQELTAHFKTYDQNPFWSKVHQIIPEKTPTQLKEYFQKSFQQCLYQQISAVDEAVLRSLERRMKDHKPAEVADVFMEMTNQKYFKRSVVVFIVNSRL